MVLRGYKNMRNLDYIKANVRNPVMLEVFKSMRDDMESNGGILNPEQFKTFMTRLMTKRTMLNDAAVKIMNTPKATFSSFDVKGHVLSKAILTEGERCQVPAAETEFGMIDLNAEMLRAKTFLFDEDLEDNIERKSFEQSLLSRVGEKIGLDLEELAVYGVKGYTGDNKELYGTFDGWLKKANQYQVKSTGAGGDIDLENGITAIFDGMRYKLRPEYRPYFEQLVFYVPFEVFDAYQNYISSRQTSLGDVNLTGTPNLHYKGIPIKYAPILDSVDGRTIFGNVPIVLTIPNFMWYGIYKNISMEPERSAACMRTDYYFRIRADVTLQWPDTFITGVITPAEAKEIIDENKS